MPERIEKLRNLIAELESELQQLEETDDEAKSLLRDASREIEEALQENAPEGLETHSLIDRLKSSTEDFEATHPTISSVVGRLVDALGQMGI